MGARLWLALPPRARLWLAHPPKQDKLLLPPEAMIPTHGTRWMLKEEKGAAGPDPPLTLIGNNGKVQRGGSPLGITGCGRTGTKGMTEEVAGPVPPLQSFIWSLGRPSFWK